MASEDASLRALESLMTEFFHNCTTNERKREIAAGRPHNRYVAISLPLHYMMTMSNRNCVTVTLLSWVSGLALPITHTVLTWKLPYCGPSVIDQFLCELSAVLQLACADTYLIKLITQVGCLFTLLMTTAFIVFSYMNILVAILKTDSAKKREKAFSTCLSHLMVVVLFYGSAVYMYMKPNSFHSPQKDKTISTLYNILTPMLNPIICSLRNNGGQESTGEAY